ncbi:glycosyltransferase [Paenibacillus typhae]|uniref:glycosyltransferase n=1 Tax=Paenibacillus typhae TaxID=1174501 RepID=UPI001C8DAC18|nr:glycosyltransferase [Paenibacillus typhae]MBY0011671.1 glycosyltransferase [Paenibacillus typhae]
MNENKLISVVVPVYNTEEYLERCLNSLLEQTYPHLQIIVVNDASTGDADTIIKNYQAIDGRILYVKHENNLGLFSARVSGSLVATGEYIAFVDSDDYLGIDFYRLLLDEAETNMSDLVLARTVLEEKEKLVFGMHDIAFPEEALTGREILNSFLAQEGRCYSWHTMWNKLYKKSLWDRCLPYYQKQTEHIIMMEDIAFSFPVFYFAEKMTKSENSVYYYCQNKGSSTDAKSAPFQKLAKNLNDMFKVFEFVKDFLDTVKVSEEALDKFYNFRNYYIRDWKKGLENVKNMEDRQKLFELLDTFYGDVGEFIKEDRLFRTTRTLWNDELEIIKRKILSPDYEYISFDFFDTLITRPFFRPTDLFYLLDKRFEQEGLSNVSFQQIRIDGEIGARAMIQTLQPDYEDITIDEIYNYIHEIYAIPEAVCDALKEEEKRLEIQFCTVRKTSKELYELALYAGKKIIIVSDMYMDEETIQKMLHKNGYEGYQQIFLSSQERRLKHTGGLFQVVLDKLQVSGKQILHLGDNYHSDVIKARDLGLHSLYFPRTINVFENKVKGLETGEVSTLAHKVSGVILDRNKVVDSIGYGAMAAIAANKYFDNPFRPFNNETDYNADPYFIGYYALGMHLSGLVNWIFEETPAYERILFMARDGYLVNKAYDIWSKYAQNAPESKYIYVSRKMLLPAATQSTVDFMNLPIVFRQYSPSSILDLLDFCTKELTEESKTALLEEALIPEEKKFESKYEYQRFMRLYLEQFYDKAKHEDAKELLQQYYSDVKETDIAFDVGYSGNIQHSFVKVAGKPVDVLFVHQDAIKSTQMSRKGNFNIKSFYDFSPAISGLLREHILSGYHAACVGLEQINNTAVPVFEYTAKPYTDIFVISKLHEGALQFIQDYTDYFHEYFDYLPFKNYEVSLPFEAFLRIPKPRDLQIFEGSYFEDNVYGRQNAINIAKHMENQYKIMPQFAGEETMELFRSAFIDSMRYSRKLVYFGAGKIGRDVLAEYPDLPVSFFLDNDGQNSGKFLLDKEIRHPDLIENWKDYYIIITTYSLEIEKQLRDLGLQKYKDFINFQEILKIV